jgi:glyoxylase-like metal-dependent hydrolase (beta-lactamase superfamily II)
LQTAIAGVPALALPWLPTRTVAQIAIGGGTLTTVSDGYLALPRSFVIGDLPEGEAVSIVEEAGYSMDDFRSPCHLAVWQKDDLAVLFDAGSGPDFMPSAGELWGSLDAAGLSPEDITHVLMTHAHPDHIWGIIDDFDEPSFYSARHFIGDREHAYWTDPSTLDTIGVARQSFAAGASRRLEIMGSDMELFGDGDEVVPGITAVSTPGHTPGHMAFRITDGGQSSLILGDAIGNAHLALARPDWVSPADQDGEMGIATRMALLEELASSGETMVGFHLPEGGIGTITAADEGFTFDPA